jgi:hypothetical protein
VKINQHANDPEMMADLYFRISKSYANTPDLRITWLINLANFHALHVPCSHRPLFRNTRSPANL